MTPTCAPTAISDKEFAQISKWFHEQAGIHLAPQKKALVSGRLASRLRHHRLDRHADYFQLLLSPGGAAERQLAVDLLTTNETSFFREPRHFQFLRELVGPGGELHGRALRCWSAACSSGEEPYTIAMTLAAASVAQWEVLASDLSRRVLERARQAIYPMERARPIPPALLAAYCLRGTGVHEGRFSIAPEVVARVKFLQVNLNDRLPELGMFNVIFLRNVMIYFDAATKQRVAERLCACLRPGGWLLVGHSESLGGLRLPLRQHAPAIYERT